jgi:anhydro-N-acetylmuramic acid kinase
MSGTSLDAIDAALCDLEPDPDEPGGLVTRLIGYREQPHPLREQLLALLRAGAVPLDILTELNVLLGEALADAALSALAAMDAPPPDLIASHGQTIFHLVAEGRARATLQLGEPAVIAERTGATVVADFRVADIAAGGQGAPLVTYFDALFFAHPTRVRAIQNIGGIANVTFVSPGDPDACYAFDTGPGNVLIDAAARHVTGGRETCDRDGAMAATGRPEPELLEHALSHPYFAQAPPRTTGRELFGDRMAEELLARAVGMGLSPEDTMATLTAITIESIVRAYHSFGPPTIDDVVIGGGGARNATLMAGLRRRLPGVGLYTHEDFGVPSEAKEALAFALLGHETLYGRPANLPRCTGASHPVILGKIVPGRNYTELMRRVMEGSEECAPIRSLRLAVS